MEAGQSRSLSFFNWLQRYRIRLVSPYKSGGFLYNLYERIYGPLIERVYKYITEHAQRGNPESVIRAFDRYSREQQWMFCLGDDKAPIVRKFVEDLKPKNCLELGTFLGYSAINASRALPPGARYTSIEPNADRTEVARRIVEYAGLQDTIEIIQGFSTDIIPTLRERGHESFDYVFLDHAKECYKSDLQLLEEHALLREGATIVADNMVIPGNPEYLEYVRTSPKYRSEYFESFLEYSSIPDGMEKSTFLG